MYMEVKMNNTAVRDIFLKEEETYRDDFLFPFLHAQISDKSMLIVNAIKVQALSAMYTENPQIPFTTRFWLDILEHAHITEIKNVCSLIDTGTIEIIDSYRVQKPVRIKEYREELCYNWYCFRKHSDENCYCELHQDEVEYEELFK